jgi:hypothetical protein
MADTKKISKKQRKQNLIDDYADKAEASKKAWLRGCKPTTELDILEAAKKD